MLLIFPLLYCGSFLYSLGMLSLKKVQGWFAFFVFGLPVYITSLSVAFLLGFGALIPVMQSFKEIIILAGLIFVLAHWKREIKLHTIDKLMLFFFGYTAIYVFLPIGQYSFFEKLLAFKSLSFFVPVYFTGRFIDLKKIYVNRFFSYICAVSIAAAILLAVELVMYTHFQAYTGFADYNYHFFGVEPSGHYGLTWTFEIENETKRFASFFSNPLEYSAATVMTICILAALYTQTDLQIKMDRFGLLVFACTAFAIFFSLSRASFASYFLILYTFALLTKKRTITRIIHYSLLAAAIYIIFLVSKDFQQFIVNTINFSNESSMGHVLEWVDGIQSIVSHPLGIGLGESGRIAAFLGENTGGENQFIIIGVQSGVIALGIYIAVYVLLITNTYRWFPKLRGKEKKICLALLLMKVGFIIPSMTANFESYIYISYISWFISGIFVNILCQKNEPAYYPKQPVAIQLQ